MSQASVQALIAEECDAIKTLLLAKNEKYGNSALEPSRIFSKASAEEQILVRIDDKLSRIRTTGQSAPDEDTVQDLIGYLVLLRVARNSPEPAPTPLRDLNESWQRPILCGHTTGDLIGGPGTVTKCGACLAEKHPLPAAPPYVEGDPGLV